MYTTRYYYRKSAYRIEKHDIQEPNQSSTEVAIQTKNQKNNFKNVASYFKAQISTLRHPYHQRYRENRLFVF